MANGSDGSLVIDTELDNEGFEKGSDKLLSAVNDLAKQVNTLGQEMKNAFSGITSILQSLATSTNSAATETSASAQQATQAAQSAQQTAQAQAQAAQQTAQAQSQAAQQTAQAQAKSTEANKAAAAAVKQYDKELAKLEKEISKVEGELSNYEAECAAVKASWKGWASEQRATSSQMQIINEMMRADLDKLATKYAKEIALIDQLREKHDQIAAARDAANVPATVTPGENATSGAAATGITDTGAAAEAATPKINLFSQIFSGLGPVMRRVGSAALSVGKSIGKIAFRSAATGVKKAVSALKSFASRAKKTATQTNSLTKALTGLRRMLFTRLKFMFISMIFKNVSEGLKQLALFDSKFNDQMSNMKNSITQLGGNIAATVANLLSALEPVITTVIELMNKAVTAVNQFFAALSGKSTYAAAKKGNQKFAESAEKATSAQKKFNRELYSFDELNRQSEKEKSAIQYEELPISLSDDIMDWINQLKKAWKSGQWYEFGKTAAEGLTMAMKTVDDWINNVLRPKGTMWAGRFAEILNGFTDGVDWPVLGKIVADGVNAIADIYNTFMYSYDWNNLGRKVGEGLNSIVQNTEWDQVGAALAAKWQALVGFVHGLVHETDWAAMGQGIGTAIESWFTSIDWVMLGDSIVTGFNGLVTMLRNAITSIDWGGVGATLGNMLTTVVTNIDWAGIGGLLSEAVKNLLRLCLNLISNIDWFAVGDSVTQGIIDMIVNIDWGAILAILGSLAVNLVASALNLVLGVISGLSETLADAFRALGMDGIAGFLQGLSDWLTNAATWIKEHIVDPVVNWVKRLFGIHSPSTVMAEIGGNVTDGLLQGISDKWSAIPEFFSRAISTLRTNVLNAWQNLRNSLNSVSWNNIGHNLVAGLNNGVAGAWGGFVNNISNMVNNLIRRIKNLFGIHSPSKVFAEIGEFLDAGLVQGIENGERGLLTTAKNVATAVTEGMTPDSPNVQMNVDSVVGSMQAIISSLGSLAVTFQTIANALTSVGGFTLPNIAAGTVVPYQTKVAANTAPAGAEGGVEAYLLGILAELQALSRSMRSGDGKQTQPISISIGGREVFQVVVDENNRVVRTTGKSPLKV